MHRIQCGVYPVSFLGFLVLEPEEMQGKTGRLHGPAFVCQLVDDRFGHYVHGGGERGEVMIWRG